MFHRGEWTDNDRALWQALTGSQETTATVLCDLAREAIRDERQKSATSEGDDSAHARAAASALEGDR